MPCEHDIECWDENACILSPRSISRLPYQTPRPHPTVPVAEQIYLWRTGEHATGMQSGLDVKHEMAVCQWLSLRRTYQMGVLVKTVMADP